MGRWLRKLVLFAVLAVGALPAHAATPLLMFLFSIAREMATNAAFRALNNRPAPIIELAKTYPGTAVEPEHLRRLINDSFLYLSDTQRREIFEALHDELMQPRNIAVAGAMI